MRDTADPLRYLTVDRWAGPESFDRFKVELAGEYENLDRHCERLTESERRVGLLTAI